MQRPDRFSSNAVPLWRGLSMKFGNYAIATSSRRSDRAASERQDDG